MTKKSTSSTCTKPDRDVPKLVCGYPLPCPHHTVVLDFENGIEADAITAAVMRVRWISRMPQITNQISPHNGGIRVNAYGYLSNVLRWNGMRDIPINCTQQEVRDACDELTREGVMALEEIDQQDSMTPLRR